MNFWQKLIITIVLIFFGAIVQALDYAPNLPYGHVPRVRDSIKQHLDAHRIEAEYIQPLDLSGKTAWNLFGIMINDGFSCGIDSETDELKRAFHMPSSVVCHKNFSKTSEFCSQFSITFKINWQDGSRSLIGLYEQLENATVKYAFGGICLHLPVLANDYYKNRDQATVQMQQYVAALKLDGITGKNAFGKLLKEGFSCSLDNTQNSLEASSLNCSMWRSKIDWCYKASIVLPIRWDKTVIKAEFEELQNTTVGTPQYACLMSMD